MIIGQCMACGQNGVEVIETVEHVGGRGLQTHRWCVDRITCQWRQGWYPQTKTAPDKAEAAKEREEERQPVAYTGRGVVSMPEPLTPNQIATIIASHLVWVRGERGGARADLSGANLSGADLSGANLSGANLSGANLYGADLSGILQIGPIGSRRGYLIVRFPPHVPEVTISAGCFTGTVAAFAEAVAETHGDNEHGRAYCAAIALIETMAAQYAVKAAGETEAANA